MSSNSSNDQAPKKLSRDAAHRRIINWYLINYVLSHRAEIEKADKTLKELALDVSVALEMFANDNGMVTTGLEIHPSTLAHVLRFLRIHYRGERSAVQEADEKEKAEKEAGIKKLAELEKAISELKKTMQ